MCHGELGRGDDVRGRSVDDHDARRGGSWDVDIVESDPGAGDDLELLRRGDRLGVDLGRGADEDRVDIDDVVEELGAVSTFGVTDLEVSSEGIDGCR